ncbi:MAG: vancomycin resistance protein [Pleurocapsa sp. SU_196_0]|nr:vancomycin resistance protein [Pleurocapsa sp. SU_196_0]
MTHGSYPRTSDSRLKWDAMKLFQTAILTGALAVAVIAVAQNTPPSVPPPTSPAPTQPSEPPVTPVPPPVAPPTPPARLPTPVPPTAKPPTKPAPATVKPLELALDTAEPEIRAGELRDVRIVRVWKMPVKSVEASRKNGKISSGIETELQKALRSIKREKQDALWYYESSTKQWVAKQQSGWTVDEATTRTSVLEALKTNKSLARVSLRRIPPARNVYNWFERGIRYHFGGGESSFRGSPSFRVQNIIAGSRQVDLTYLKAGEVFDFNARVKISSTLGFVEGYIISGGTLVKDIGGGICQVSTTVWSSRVPGWVAIVQRNNHSYRVHYYDPPGFEATVFSPYKNLKFRNDTSTDMFIQMTWYTRSQRLTLDFFGAKPDRKVAVTKPYIYNVRAPGRTRFQADPTVRLGRVRRIDSAEQGMSVRINRTVNYNDGRNLSDVTRSVYVPWGAIYAVNPADYRVAPPKPQPPKPPVLVEPVIPPPPPPVSTPGVAPITPTPPTPPAPPPAEPNRP